MPNIGNIIKSHNTKTLQKEDNFKVPPCNCRKKNDCPLEGKCRIKSVIYQATISAGNESFHYVGLTESEFKTRFNNHKQSMRNDKYRLSTELSKKYWDLKDRGQTPSVKWKILQQARPYKVGQSNCDVCSSEKLYIVKFKGTDLLNKRNELISKCRHKRKFSLEKVWIYVPILPICAYFNFVYIRFIYKGACVLMLIIVIVLLSTDDRINTWNF